MKQVEKRHVNIIMALFFSLCSFNSQALTLGEIELHSFINEPLRATLPILSLSNEELNHLTVMKASIDTYNKMNIPYTKSLKKLSIKIRKNKQEHYLEITSTALVKEPMLDILLHIKNQRGQIIHGITLMLQPKGL